MLLQNCHLAPSWMPKLDRMLDQYGAGAANKRPRHEPPDGEAAAAAHGQLSFSAPGQLEAWPAEGSAAEEHADEGEQAPSAVGGLLAELAQRRQHLEQ